jgi:hypothetical protein
MADEAAEAPARSVPRMPAPTRAPRTATPKRERAKTPKAERKPRRKVRRKYTRRKPKDDFLTKLMAIVKVARTMGKI